MKNNAKKTIVACFIGYIVQAIVVNFLPLLFVKLQSQYHIPLSQITVLITVNFLVQLMVDVLCVSFVDRIGYRISALLAHLFSAIGLALLALLPDLLPSPFVGILICTVIYAIGGGLLEAQIIENARARIIPDKTAEVCAIDMYAKADATPDMICGGACEVLVAYIDGNDENMLSVFKAAVNISVLPRSIR